VKLDRETGKDVSGVKEEVYKRASINGTGFR